MDEMTKLIRNCAVFSGLSDAELKAVSSVAEKQEFKRGATLAAEAAEGDRVFLVLHGRVDVQVTLVGGKDRETISSLGEGEMVGELVLLGKLRRSAYLVAKEDVTVLTWESSELLNLFNKELHIGYLVMRQIASRLAERLIATNQMLRNAMAYPSNIF